MARKRKAAPQHWLIRFRYLIALLVGGGGAGVGGWHYRDSFLGRVVERVRESPVGERIEGYVEGRVAAVIEHTADYKKAGVFEVRIARLSLDPEAFKAGHTVDMQVIVKKVDEDGKHTTVWDSKPFGQRRAIVGKDPLAANWEDNPFEVDWTPGDRFTVEVHDRNGVLASKALLMHEDDGDLFPLTSGVHPIEPAARETALAHPENSRIVMKTRRVSDLAGSPRGPRDEEAGIARGRDNGDTIRIK